MQRLLLLGLNHTTAPLSVRERVAFSRDQQRAAIAELRQQYPECEFVLLSTCNRVEIYAGRAIHGHPRIEEILQFLASFHGVAQSIIAEHSYQKVQFDVVEHLFGVAASLDSMVPGETEILGQVRDGYELACELGSTGPLLNPLFQRAIAAGKDVASGTSLPGRPPSVAREAVQLARDTIGTFSDKTLLTIGAGDVARDLLRHIRPLNPGRLLVSNRDSTKARELVCDVGGEVVEFDQIIHRLNEVDAVMTSTASSAPILGRRDFEFSPRRSSRSQLVLDLGVPRDVDPAVRELPFVRLHDLDDLQQALADSHRRRDHALDGARAIVGARLAEYAAWQRARDFGPAIEALYQRYHDLAEQELQRAIGGMAAKSPDEVEQLREFSRRIVNKLLHDPVQALRNADGLQSPGVNYVAAVQKLFGLEIRQEEQS